MHLTYHSLMIIVILFGCLIYLAEQGDFTVNEQYPNGAYLKVTDDQTGLKVSNINSAVQGMYWATTLGINNTILSSNLLSNLLPLYPTFNDTVIRLFYCCASSFPLHSTPFHFIISPLKYSVKYLWSTLGCCVVVVLLLLLLLLHVVVIIIIVVLLGLGNAGMINPTTNAGKFLQSLLNFISVLGFAFPLGVISNELDRYVTRNPLCPYDISTTYTYILLSGRIGILFPLFFDILFTPSYSLLSLIPLVTYSLQSFTSTF